MALKATSQNTAMPPPSSSSTTLEVTVISAEDVRLPDGRSLKRGAYATVRSASSVASTDVDRDDCNGYPLWNEKLRLSLPAYARMFYVEILQRRPGGAVEPVAVADVPVDDFTVGPPGYLHCLSYRLIDAGGKRRNGIVNISVKRLPGDGDATVGRGVPVPALGEKEKAVCASSSGSGSCGMSEEAKEEGGVPGVVIGYPVGFSGSGKS